MAPSFKKAILKVMGRRDSKSGQSSSRSSRDSGNAKPALKCLGVRGFDSADELVQELILKPLDKDYHLPMPSDYAIHQLMARDLYSTIVTEYATYLATAPKTARLEYVLLGLQYSMKLRQYITDRVCRIRVFDEQDLEKEQRMRQDVAKAVARDYNVLYTMFQARVSADFEPRLLSEYLPCISLDLEAQWTEHGKVERLIYWCLREADGGDDEDRVNVCRIMARNRGDGVACTERAT